MSILTDLITALDSGALKVIDLTQPLGPDTPVIGLPPIFASSPGVSIDVISRYDEKGPGWYWNTIRMGEHTGTHFDAPVHWITGKDSPQNRCDTIPARRFIGPACVGERARPDSARRMGATAHRLEQAHQSLAVPQREGRWPA
jgi:isatin hydrolase